MENVNLDNKTDLRRKFRALRDNIDPAARMTLDAEILRRVKVLPEVLRTNVAFVYLSRNGEAGTNDLVHVLLEAGKTVLTPSPDIQAMPHDGLFRIHREEPGRHSEPYLCTESRIDQVDLIIVPGIVWDQTGHRIGFGGGYFDRLLAMARRDCVKIGLAYDCQLIDKVPSDSWDIPVDILVTDNETIRTREISGG